MISYHQRARFHRLILLSQLYNLTITIKEVQILRTLPAQFSINQTIQYNLVKITQSSYSLLVFVTFIQNIYQ